MERKEYLPSPWKNVPFIVAPYQAKLLKDAQDLIIDTDYTANRAFPYLLNIVVFKDFTLSFNAVSRSFAASTTEVFQRVTMLHPSFKGGTHLRQIMVDFDRVQYKGRIRRGSRWWFSQKLDQRLWRPLEYFSE